MQKKPCNPWQERNPITGRCKKKTGVTKTGVTKTGVTKNGDSDKNVTPCPPGKIRNPATGKCVNIDGKIGKKIVLEAEAVPVPVPVPVPKTKLSQVTDTPGNGKHQLPPDLLRHIGDQLSIKNAAKMTILNKDMNLMYKDIVIDKLNVEFKSLKHIMDAMFDKQLLAKKLTFDDDFEFVNKFKKQNNVFIPLELEINIKYDVSKTYESNIYTRIKNFERNDDDNIKVGPYMSIFYTIADHHVKNKKLQKIRDSEGTSEDTAEFIPLLLKHMPVMKKLWKKHGTVMSVKLTERKQAQYRKKSQHHPLYFWHTYTYESFNFKKPNRLERLSTVEYPSSKRTGMEGFFESEDYREPNTLDPYVRDLSKQIFEMLQA
jgi:hypothetical protein